MNQLLIILFSLLPIMSIAQDKPQLIYVGDPMCSWCYGFAPEITKLKDEFSATLEFKLIVGGLRPNGNETMKHLRDFLQHHWEDVNKRSGQPFKYEILKDTSFVYNTEPACRAVIVARAMNPKIELEFFKAIQTAFYAKNLNTSEIETYLTIAEQFNLDKNKFSELYQQQEIKEKTIADFQQSSQLGATGFPTTLLKYNGKIYTIAKGYSTANEISKQIHDIID